MLCALLTLALVQTPLQQPPRLRTILPSGAIVLVERMPTASHISVQLFASSRSVQETKETNGYRHLLEHLMMKGEKHDIDERLESRGAFLRARTLRDAMQIEIESPADGLDADLDALRETLRPVVITQPEIEKESLILNQELALQERSAVLGARAWEQAYGDQGLDPAGKAEAFPKATPEALADIRANQFTQSNLVLVVAGDIDLDKVTAKARRLLESLPAGSVAKSVVRKEGSPGRIESDSFGEARAALAPGFREPRTAWAMAAGLAIGTELHGAFVIYTPCSENGLVIVGRTESISGVGLYVDALDESGQAALFGRGKLLAYRWMARQLETPEGAAYIRGLLLTQSSSLRPEMFLQNVSSMTQANFLEGMRMFAKDRCVISVGVGG